MQSVGLRPAGLAEEAPRRQTVSALAKIVVFGHSHMGALLAAFDQQVAQGQQSCDLVSYQFLRADRQHIVNIDDTWRYNPECEQELLPGRRRSSACCRASRQSPPV